MELIDAFTLEFHKIKTENFLAYTHRDTHTHGNAFENEKEIVLGIVVVIDDFLLLDIYFEPF